MMTLEPLDRAEALRYMGGADVPPDDSLCALIDECEQQIMQSARPRYLYRVIDLPCPELTVGKDIAEHLSGCDKAALMCATLGAGTDRLIRIAQVSDMARAVVLNSLASVAVEQVCDRAERELAQRYPERHFTFRFSPGYGDYPISLQKTLLSMLDAPRKIGLTASDNHILIPSKSVTAVTGISPEPIEKKKQGCAVCNMRTSCRYRKVGEHCGF